MPMVFKRSCGPCCQLVFIFKTGSMIEGFLSLSLSGVEHISWYLLDKICIKDSLHSIIIILFLC